MWTAVRGQTPGGPRHGTKVGEHIFVSFTSGPLPVPHTEDLRKIPSYFQQGKEKGNHSEKEQDVYSQQDLLSGETVLPELTLLGFYQHLTGLEE